MSFNCINTHCQRKVESQGIYCKNCSKKRDNRLIKDLELYLSENFCFNENYQMTYPFKIVDYQNFKHGIRITDYSPEFLRMLNSHNQEGISADRIFRSIKFLKCKNSKLYESLKYLWGQPLRTFKCHKSTVYRRIHRALKIIACDIGLLNSQELN